MKCEHEGCLADGEQIRIVRLDLPSMPVTDSPVLCRHHLAAWVREYADEVEGVKECPECRGKKEIGEESGVEEFGMREVLYHECHECHGTGKVPR